MSNGNQSYQYLMLLVRDWIFSDDFACGFEGGNMYLSKIIGIKDNNNPSLTDLRQFILHSFQDLDCFLLQNPGTISKGGIWKGFSREFKNNLSVLSSFLLAPGSLIVKQNNGKPLVASDLHKLICDLMVAPRPETFEEENFEYLILQDLDDTSGVAANAVPFDCPVCLDFKQIGDGITLRECLHSFCKECLRGTIIHSEDARVKCPFSNNDFNCDIYLQVKFT